MAGMFCLAALPAFAQAHHPFSVGITEGGGTPTGLMGWIMSQQGSFERAIAAAVRNSKADGSALWLLMGLSFVYGVLHAAGPGHGKAVLASYMLADRRALRRGIALSFAAALLQATVAIAAVTALSYLVHATEAGMRGTLAVVEKLSYAGVLLLGLWLVWRKGLAFRAEWVRRGLALPAMTPSVRPAFAAAGAAAAGAAAAGAAAAGAASRVAFDRSPAIARSERPVARSAFACQEVHDYDASCAHCHAPDPAALGDGFSWREALSTVASAGARPCSGAVLVLVFSIAQGMLAAGVLSTLVMALGTALTTAGLASLAVLAKPLARRLAGSEARNGRLAVRGLELLAALVVLGVGTSLLLGVGPLQGLA